MSWNWDWKINIDAKETVKHILSKVFSARFIIVVLMMSTFCWITNKSLNLLILNINNKEVYPVIEKIMFILVGAFITQVGNIVITYFNRPDRKENGGQK